MPPADAPVSGSVRSVHEVTKTAKSNVRKGKCQSGASRIAGFNISAKRICLVDGNTAVRMPTLLNDEHVGRARQVDRIVLA